MSNSLFKYGPFANVSLTTDEMGRLQERFGDLTQERIDSFSEQKKAHGYKYKSDFAAILSWARKDERTKANGHGDYSKFVKRAE